MKDHNLPTTSSGAGIDATAIRGKDVIGTRRGVARHGHGSVGSKQTLTEGCLVSAG